MRIKAYVRLQKCTTKDRRAFVGRSFQYHGIAAGPVQYFAVEAASWSGIRGVLRTFDVMGYSGCGPKTVCAYAKDIGDPHSRLWKLTIDDVPQAARWSPAWLQDGLDAPELTGFGVQAVEVQDPN